MIAGQADVLDGGQRLVEGVGDGGLRVLEADARHRLAEELAVLGLLDRFALGADQLDAVFREHAHVVEGQRGVEAGLAAHGRQEGVGALLLDDLGDDLRGDRLDVGGVGHLRVGHDRRRVGVDQDDAVALLAQRLAGLGAGVVELAGLADDDRPRPDDHDRADVGSLRHAGLARSARRRGGSRGRGFAKGRQIAVVIEAVGGRASCFGAPAARGRQRSEDQVVAGEVGVRVEADGEVGGAVAVEVGGQAAGDVAQLAGAAGEGVAADAVEAWGRGAARRRWPRGRCGRPVAEVEDAVAVGGAGVEEAEDVAAAAAGQGVAAEAAVDAVGAAVAVERGRGRRRPRGGCGPRCRRGRRRRGRRGRGCGRRRSAPAARRRRRPGC